MSTTAETGTIRCVIYGHDDDTVHVEADEWFDEFFVYGAPSYLHFADGTIVEASWATVPGKGWTLRVLQRGEGTRVKELPAEMDEDGEEHQTDVIELVGPLGRCRQWSAASGATMGDLGDWFESRFEAKNYSRAELLAAYETLQGAGR